MKLRVAGLVLAGALTGACDTVEFQSPPAEPLAACDPALVGDWRVEDLREEPDASGRQYLRVSTGCERWLTLSVEPDEAGGEKADIDDLEEDLVLGFARTSGQAWIAARDAPKPGDTDPQDKPNGYTLIAWNAADDGSVVLRQVDLRKVSHLIVDDKVPGWIEKRDRGADGRRDLSSGFWVYVFGSADEVRALLEAHELLDAPWMRLKPADAAGRAEIDRWLADAAGGDPAKGFEKKAADPPSAP